MGGLLAFIVGAGLFGLGYMLGRRHLEEDIDAGRWLPADRRRWRG